MVCLEIPFSRPISQLLLISSCLRTGANVDEFFHSAIHMASSPFLHETLVPKGNLWTLALTVHIAISILVSWALTMFTYQYPRASSASITKPSLLHLENHFWKFNTWSSVMSPLVLTSIFCNIQLTFTEIQYLKPEFKWEEVQFGSQFQRIYSMINWLQDRNIIVEECCSKVILL